MEQKTMTTFRNETHFNVVFFRADFARISLSPPYHDHASGGLSYTQPQGAVMSQFFFNQRTHLVSDVIDGTIIASPVE